MYDFYDLIIRNGSVIDPAAGTIQQRDVFVKNGVFAQADSDSQGNEKALREIDASDCYVAPGFIDAHIHLNSTGSQLGIPADMICPPCCVTTAIDPGSSGLYNFQGFYEHEIVPSHTTIKAAISPTKSGVQLAPHEEIVDPVFGTPEKLRPFFEGYGQTLVGIKQRVNREVTGEYGLSSLEQSAKTARVLREEGFRCQLMIHFGDLGDKYTLSDVLNLLEAGDVLTHIYRPAIGTTVFESGCARSHCSFESIRKGFADGFCPQIISTDIINQTAFFAPSGWLPLKMSIYLEAGMTLTEVVKAVTHTPAGVWGLFSEAGSMTTGSPADAAIFKLSSVHRRLEDLYGGAMDLHQLIVPMATVKKGNVVFQQITL